MAESLKCMIIGAAPIADKRIFREFNPKEHYVICADGGYETALRYGVRPDMIVGDFDSATKLPPSELNCLTLPVKKDVTDTMYAAMRGIAMGLQHFVLLGCLGGKRFDHSLANLEVLHHITTRGGTAILADETTRAIMLSGRSMRITDSIGATLSVFPYGGSSCNVTYRGMEYPLHRRTLTVGGMPMGVSNKILVDPAEVTVHSGMGLVVMYKE